MSLEQNIQAALLPLASGGAYQDVAAQGTVAPYIVWSEVTSTINNTLQGASNLQNTRVQVDCYATSAGARSTLADAVAVAITAAPFQSVQLTSENLYEQDTKLFRAILDFSIWSI